MSLDLDTVKLHLRVDHTDEDDLIRIYLRAAEERVEQFLDRKVYATEVELTAAGDASGMVANGSTEAATLLIVGHLFASREDVVVGAPVSQLPSGSQYLLMPFRVNLGV